MYFFWGLHFASPKLRKSINPRQNWDFGKNAESRSDHAECCLAEVVKGVIMVINLTKKVI